jgi:hypothetical protein
MIRSIADEEAIHHPGFGINHSIGLRATAPDLHGINRQAGQTGADSAH